MEIPFLIFGGAIILFSTTTVPFYIPTNGAQGFNFSTVPYTQGRTSATLLPPPPHTSGGRVTADLQLEYLGDGG